MGIGEAQCFEFSSQPLRSRCLAPGWSRNRRDLELQVFEFAAMGTKPGERLVYGPKLGQSGYHLLRRWLDRRISAVRRCHSREGSPVLRTKGHVRW